MAYIYKVLRNGTCVSCFLLMFSCLLPQQVMAQDTVTAQQQIEQQLTQLLEKELDGWQLQAGVSKVERAVKVRLPSGTSKLKPCPTALIIESSGALPLGNVQRRVGCESPRWNLYVRASVQVSARLPVANRTLKRGEHISAADIEWQQVKLSVSDRDLVTELEQIIGQQVVRKLRRHRVIKAQQLGKPQWVNIGDKVIIEARSNGFYANMAGEALEAGGEGKAIRVRNLSSGKIISAYPIAKGRVATQF